MSRRGLEAKCPFWIDRHDKPYGTICCEGVTKDCYTMLRFRKHEKALAYKKQHCAGDFKMCRLFKALIGKYE